jgi:hypothetical protein
MLEIWSMSNDPLASEETAYKALDEKQYKAEMELADRYQAFTAELLRLALLGIASALGLSRVDAPSSSATPHFWTQTTLDHLVRSNDVLG